MRWLVLAVGLFAIGAATGCGPIQVSSAVKRANIAMSQAQLNGWDKDCPYEITAAEGYLAAAHDLIGRSEFGAATEFADKAARLATSTQDNAARNARTRQIRESSQKETSEPAPAFPSEAPGTGGAR
jgi:hypothetical protein